MDWFFSVEEAAEWLKSFGIGAVLISLLLNICISVLGFVPSLFLSGANAVVFGIVPGYFISLAGEVLGAGVSFWLYRFGVSKIKKINVDEWSWLQSINTSSRGKQMMLLLLARLTPLMPSGLITVVAALSSVKFLDFMIISLVGKAPSIALETLIGHDMIRLNDNFPRLFITLMFMGVMLLLFRKKNQLSKLKHRK
jgi:uncharacterized membrane protein YdjX (TVP38/TMEM64 family)